MLKATDLSFGYSKARPIGHGVNFSVSAGEVFCLLGPNGCGKTTLFKTLLGLIPILDGRLELDGHPVAGISRRSFARRVAYVPQANTAYFPFSVFDVVLMGRASRIGAFESPSRSDREIATAKLEELGILHLANRAYTEISGGERQMTLIARALAQQPALIGVDELIVSLDRADRESRLRQPGARPQPDHGAGRDRARGRAVHARTRLRLLLRRHGGADEQGDGPGDRRAGHSPDVSIARKPLWGRGRHCPSRRNGTGNMRTGAGQARAGQAYLTEAEPAPPASPATRRSTWPPSRCSRASNATCLAS